MSLIGCLANGSFLKYLPNLETLILKESYVQLTDKHLKYLKKCKYLTIDLRGGNCEFTYKG